MKKTVLAPILAATMIATAATAVQAEKLEYLPNSDKRAEVPMYKITGSAPHIDGTFKADEWKDFLLVDAQKYDNPLIYNENSYNKLTNDEWYKKIFTPSTYYAAYDDTYVYVCAVTKDTDHTAISDWEGDYCDLRFWNKDAYNQKYIFQMNDSVMKVNEIKTGTKKDVKYAFGRDEATSLTCYEFRIPWETITGAGADEFRLNVTLGIGTAVNKADCTDYPPFIGMSGFGFADVSFKDDNVYNGHTMIPAGEKPAAPVKEAAKTADPASVMALGALLSASAAYIVSKKKH
ncbi:MAG: hypothetical protein IJF67_00185 [Clostridia bacterium]|nr:hypothetical protein [Clostridia bacterium]